MDELDRKLINDLSRDSRVSYAELGRKYHLSRVSIRERVNNLVEKGVIKKFTIEVDPAKLGKHISAFFDIEVRPHDLYKVARELIKEEKVSNIFILTGSTTLYVNAALEDREELESFLQEKLYARNDIQRVNTRIMLKQLGKENNEWICPLSNNELIKKSEA